MRSMTSRLPFELSQGELKRFPIFNFDKSTGKSKTSPYAATYILYKYIHSVHHAYFTRAKYIRSNGFRR